HFQLFHVLQALHLQAIRPRVQRPIIEDGSGQNEIFVRHQTSHDFVLAHWMLAETLPVQMLVYSQDSGRDARGTAAAMAALRFVRDAITTNKIQTPKAIHW